MSQLYAVKLANGNWWRPPAATVIISSKEGCYSAINEWKCYFPELLLSAKVVPIRLEEAPDAR